MTHQWVNINIYPSLNVACTFGADNHHPATTPKLVPDPNRPDDQHSNELKDVFEDVHKENYSFAKCGDKFDNRYKYEDDYKYGEKFDNRHDNGYELGYDDALENTFAERTDDNSDDIHSDGQSIYDINQFTESNY